MNFRQKALVFIVISPVITIFISLHPSYNLDRMDKSSAIPPLSPRLVQISGTIWLYSAFLENIRYSDNVTVVTVLGIADDAIKKQTFECRIELTAGESVEAAVTVVKIEDKYRLKYDLWKVLCKASVVLKTRPVRVTISSNNSEPVTIPVAREQEFVGQVGCCLAGPLWRDGLGDKGVMDLIGWVEFQRLLGVEKILVYAMRQWGELREVLDHYIREGVMEVTEWNFPISNTYFRYFGQNLIINDCLYRSRDMFNYTIFIDLDETFVPALHDNLTDLLQNLTESKVSAFGLTNRFHHTHWKVPHSSLQSLYPSLTRIPDIQQVVLTHKVRMAVLTITSNHLAYSRTPANGAMARGAST
jgi:hypothetical protein